MRLLFPVCEVKQQGTRIMTESLKSTELTAEVQVCPVILEKNFIVLLIWVRSGEAKGEAIRLDRLFGPSRFHVVGNAKRHFTYF